MNRYLVLLVIFAVFEQSALASDWTIGGSARAFGMGGAGLAVLDRNGRGTQVNPASLGLLSRRTILEFPSIGFRTNGIPFDKAFDHATGNANSSNLATLARDFGQRDSSVGLSFGWGARFGHLSTQGQGVGTVRVLPDSAFQAWARAGGDITNTTPGMRADLLGAAIYTLPTVGIAERITPPGSPTRVTIGARVKLANALFSHYFVNDTVVANGGNAIAAPELGGRNHLSKSGVGVDVGFLVHPETQNGWTGAFVITNLLEPNLTFNGTGVSGAAARYELQPRSFSLGTAWHGDRITFALDGVDLGRAYSNAQGRAGLEYSSRRWAIRGGYSTARGFTVGFGLSFIDIAIGQRQPLEIAQVLRF